MSMIDQRLLPSEWGEIVKKFEEYSLKTLLEMRKCQVRLVLSAGLIDPSSHISSSEIAFQVYKNHLDIALIQGLTWKMLLEKCLQPHEFGKKFDGLIPILAIPVFYKHDCSPQWINFLQRRMIEDGWETDIVRLKTLIYRSSKNPFSHGELFYRYHFCLCVSDPR